VAEGLTNAEVAQRLYLSPRTIKKHLNSIYHWPRCTDSSSYNVAFALRLSALRGTSSGATMTIPGAAGTLYVTGS
jgi:DNA-binding NarL/FixJ family response regulator